MGLRDYFSSPPPPPPTPPTPPQKPPITTPPDSNATTTTAAAGKDDGILERIYDGDVGESTDSSIRYAAYGMRIRTILSAAHRYVAYTSDIGESFRPVAHPWLVKGAYGMYLLFHRYMGGWEGGLLIERK